MVSLQRHLNQDVYTIYLVRVGADGDWDTVKELHDLYLESRRDNHQAMQDELDGLQSISLGMGTTRGSGNKPTGHEWLVARSVCQVR